MPAQRLCSLISAFVLLSSIVAAQPPPGLPRDAVRRPQTGTARITGRVVDGQTGATLARARVRLQGSQGPPPSALSDETGAFQFSDLPAGSYSLTVERNGYANAQYPDRGQTVRVASRPLIVADGQTVDGLTIPLYRGAAITGRVLDARGEPMEFGQVQVLRVPSGGGKPIPRGGGATNDLGEYRLAKLEPGRYIVMASHRPPPEDPAQEQPVTTYYPGVVSIEQAVPIALERAQTVSGIELMLIEAAAHWVTGSIVDAKGQPVAAGGSVNVRSVGAAAGAGIGGFGTGVRPDGTFRLKLPAGEYDVQAQAVRAGVSGPRGPDDEMFGFARISVSGPVSDLTMMVGPGATLSGRLIFEGDAALPSNPEQVRVNVFGGRDGGMCRSGPLQVSPDWTFRVAGVAGTCGVNVSQAGPWAVKAVLHDDVDLLDDTMLFTPGQSVRDVRVVFTDRRTQLTLHVTDEHGAPTREYVAIVFPADRTKWSIGSRYVRLYAPQVRRPDASTSPRGSTALAGASAGRPDVVMGLPPGAYYAVAVDDIGTDESRDPATFEKFLPTAARLTVNEGAPTELTLRRMALRGHPPQ